jgi:hypothetical protein
VLRFANVWRTCASKSLLPADREFERCGRRSIEPLQVVDCEHDVALGREAAQQRQQRRTDCSPLRRPARRFDPEQCDVERQPLGPRQRLDRRGRNRIDEVRQRSEGEPGFGLGRSGNEEERLAAVCTCERLLPHRRLADARLADDRERGEPELGGEKRLDRGKLRVTPDN